MKLLQVIQENHYQDDLYNHDKDDVFVKWFTSDDGNNALEAYWHDYCDNEGLDADEVDEHEHADDFKDWIYDNIFNDLYYEAIHDLNHAVSFDGTIDLYRMISIKDLRRLRLSQVGEYWSWDEHAAEAHWGDSGHRYYVRMHATGHSDNVEWFETVCQNTFDSFKHEREIKIKRSSTLLITKIEYIEQTGRKIIKVKHFDPPKKVKA